MEFVSKKSFPTYINDYAPKLVEFFGAWINWLNQEGNAAYNIDYLSSEHDIDESVDAFKTHLRNLLIQDFPKVMCSDSTLTTTQDELARDLKLLLKNIFYLYNAKSSVESYEFLFGCLFNKAMEIVYPRERVLRVDDGRFEQRKFITFTGNNDIYLKEPELKHCLLVGNTSKAKAFIDSPFEHTFFIWKNEELYKDALQEDAEKRAELDEKTKLLEEPIGVQNNTRYPDEPLPVLTDSKNINTSNFSAIADVGVIEKYDTTIYENEITIWYYKSLWERDTNSDPELKENYIIAITTQKDMFCYELRDVHGSFIQTTYNKDTTIAKDEYGRELLGESVYVINPETGQKYTFPEIHIQYFDISEIIWSYSFNPHFKVPSDKNWTDSKGFLDSDKVLQNGSKYQDFSYEIKTEVSFLEWRDLVQKILHPAGLKYFGEYKDASGDVPSMMYNPILPNEDGKTRRILLEEYLNKYFPDYTEEQREAFITEYLSHTTPEEYNERLKYFQNNQYFSFINKFHLIFTLYMFYVGMELDTEFNKFGSAYFGLHLFQLAQTHSETVDTWLRIGSYIPWDDYARLEVGVVDSYFNKSSVMLFRDDGTNINPDIINWHELSFDEAVSTKHIVGLTLHSPKHACISTVIGNMWYPEYEEDFIDDNFLIFTTRTNDNEEHRVKNLILSNEVKYYPVDEEGHVIPEKKEDWEVERFTKNDTVKKIPTTFLEWNEIEQNDFVETRSGLLSKIYDRNSLLKMPDETVDVVHTKINVPVYFTPGTIVKVKGVDTEKVDTDFFNNFELYEGYILYGDETHATSYLKEVVDYTYQVIKEYEYLDAYIIKGATALSRNWLTFDTKGITGITPLIPEVGKVYCIRSTGSYLNKTYQWNNVTSKYEPLNATRTVKAIRVEPIKGTYKVSEFDLNGKLTQLGESITLINTTTNTYIYLDTNLLYFEQDLKNSKDILAYEFKDRYFGYTENFVVYAYAPYDFSERYFIKRENKVIDFCYVSYDYNDRQKFNSFGGESLLERQEAESRKYILNQSASIAYSRYGDILTSYEVKNNKRFIKQTYNITRGSAIYEYFIELPRIVQKNEIILFVNGLYSSNYTLETYTVTLLDGTKQYRTQINIDTRSLSPLVHEIDELTYDYSVEPFANIFASSVISTNSSDLGIFETFTENTTVVFSISKTETSTIINKKKLSEMTLKDMCYTIESIDANNPYLNVEFYISSPNVDTLKMESTYDRERNLFTYNDVRLMPYMPYNTKIKTHYVFDLRSMLKETIESYMNIKWFHIMLTDDMESLKWYRYTFLGIAQNHSELMDDLMDDPLFRHQYTDEVMLLKYTNASSTMVFDDSGLLIQPYLLNGDKNIIWNERRIKKAVDTDKLYALPANALQPVETLSISKKTSVTKKYPGEVFVFINGLKLKETEYVDNGTTITFNEKKSGTVVLYHIDPSRIVLKNVTDLTGYTLDSHFVAVFKDGRFTRDFGFYRYKVACKHCGTIYYVNSLDNIDECCHQHQFDLIQEGTFIRAEECEIYIYDSRDYHNRIDELKYDKTEKIIEIDNHAFTFNNLRVNQLAVGYTKIKGLHIDVFDYDFYKMSSVRRLSIIENHYQSLLKKYTLKTFFELILDDEDKEKCELIKPAIVSSSEFEMEPCILESSSKIVDLKTEEYSVVLDESSKTNKLVNYKPGYPVYVTTDNRFYENWYDYDNEFWLKLYSNRRTTMMFDDKGMLIHPNSINWSHSQFYVKQKNVKNITTLTLHSDQLAIIDYFNINDASINDKLIQPLYGDLLQDLSVVDVNTNRTYIVKDLLIPYINNIVTINEEDFVFYNDGVSKYMVPYQPNSVITTGYTGYYDFDETEAIKENELVFVNGYKMYKDDYFIYENTYYFNNVHTKEESGKESIKELGLLDMNNTVLTKELEVVNHLGDLNVDQIVDMIRTQVEHETGILPPGNTIGDMNMNDMLYTPSIESQEVVIYKYNPTLVVGEYHYNDINDIPFDLDEITPVLAGEDRKTTYSDEHIVFVNTNVESRCIKLPKETTYLSKGKNILLFINGLQSYNYSVEDGKLYIPNDEENIKTVEVYVLRDMEYNWVEKSTYNRFEKSFVVPNFRKNCYAEGYIEIKVS